MWPDLGAIRDGIIFNLLNMIGGILWTLDRIMMMVGAILHWFRVLLVGGGGQDNLLGLLMTQLLQGNDLLKQLVYLGLMLAFMVLAFTLIARPLIGRFQAVEFNKVILWFFIAVIIFSAGPGMVSGLESTRLGLQEQAHLIASTIQYQNEVNRYNNQVVPNTVGDFWLPGQTPGYVPHLFGTAVGSNCSSGCNGLDASAAFLGAEEGDITGARADAVNTGGYPRALYDRYFTWRDGNEEERGASVRNAKDGVMRLLQGMLPAFFSIVEAVIFLLFAVAAMILFISLPVAIPFAFFSLTEIIATSVLRAYLFLVVRTFVVATMLAFLVQMLIIFAQRGTALVFIAIATLTMLLSFQFVRMAMSTMTEALNVIGSAVGSATGVSVRQTDPFAAAGRVAGMAALAGAAVATGGGALAGAATLLHRQGGLRGGGLNAVGSAALHAARVRAGAAVGRTPLAGLQRGYSAMHSHHQMAREHTYQLESARALLLDRDAEEAAAVLMDQKKSVSPARKEWAVKKVREWTSVEESRQKYRGDMRGAGLGRLRGGPARAGHRQHGRARLAQHPVVVAEELARRRPGPVGDREDLPGRVGRVRRQEHAVDQVVDVERAEDAPAHAGQGEAVGSDRLEREHGPRPRSRPVDVAGAQDHAVDLARGMRLQDHVLGRDLRVDVGDPLGPDGMGLVDAVGEVGVPERAHGREVDEALDAAADGGVEHVPGAEHVRPPLHLRRDRVGDDRGGVDHRRAPLGGLLPRPRLADVGGGDPAALVGRAVQPAHLVPLRSKEFEEAIADEAGRAGDQDRALHQEKSSPSARSM